MPLLFIILLCLAGTLPALAQLEATAGIVEVRPFSVGRINVVDRSGKAVRVRYLGVLTVAEINNNTEPRIDNPANYLMFNRTEITTPGVFEFMINPWREAGGGSLRVVFETADEQPLRRVFGTVSYGSQITPDPVIKSVVNTFSQQQAISPGSLVTIYSPYLSLATLTGECDLLSRLPTDMRQYAVRFNGIAAPLLEVTHDRIKAIVPYEIAGSTEAEVILWVPQNRPFVAGGHRSPAVMVPVQETAPAIRTIDHSGRGLVDARQIANEVWSQHGPENPVPRGGAVELFVTGAGLWATQLRGDIAFGDARPQPINPFADFLAFTGQPLSVTIGGVPAKVLYAGATFLRPWALLQVNVVVPDGAPSGQQPVILKIGNNDNAAQRATLLIQ